MESDIINDQETIEFDRDESLYTDLPEENGQYEFGDDGSQVQLDDDVVAVDETENHENEDIGINMGLQEISEEISEDANVEATSKPKEDNMMVVDEWDDESLDSFSDEEINEEDKAAINPELMEKAIINMPTLKSLYDDTGAFKQNRRVFVYPITMEDFANEKLVEVMTRHSCQEVKVQWVRSAVDQSLTGIVSLQYMTPSAAARAISYLENFKEDIQIKTDTVQIVEEFVSKNQSKRRIIDCILILKNLTATAKVEAIKEMFPEVDEIVLKVKPDKSDAASHRGYAYLLFETAEVAYTAILEASNKRLELDGQAVFVVKYKAPIETIPRAYLKLNERKLILRLIEKLKKKMEIFENNPTPNKSVEEVKKRLAACQLIIEKDDKCRKVELSLEQPTLEDFQKMSGLPVLTPAEQQKILERYHVGKAKKNVRTPSKNEHSSKVRGAGGAERGRKGTWKRPPHRSPPRPRRRTPPRFRERNMRGYNHGRKEGSSNMGGPMMNPLAWMMQQNLGMMGGNNVMGPGLMLPQNMMMGSAGMLGPQQGMGSLLSGNMDLAGDMLRLDETGNYRPEQRGHRYSPQRDRDERFNKRRRSRSPRGVQDERMSATMAAMKQDSAPGSNPVNLLMNLSQILSQKMENQRMLDKRDRDYRTGFR